MTIINENTVVVFSSEELKTALENENNYTTIYFGNDISLLNGIKISNTKTNVIIDGTYNGTTYKLEDKKSASASDTISVGYNTIKKVTVQNMNIIGYNYYGIIYVPESNTYKDVIVEYNNITYLGPQISFHPNGLTRFIDCNITIQENYATGNEVAECNKIEIGGSTTILHKSKSNSSFWFRNTNPSLKILENATFNFTSESRELFYGVNNLTFTISKKALVYITTHSGMGYGTFGTGATTIDQDASLYLKQTDYNNSNATWYSYGTITLNEHSTLSIINDYNNITATNYNIYFSGSNAGFILNDPFKVVLYNKVANCIYSNATTPFNFTFKRINLFDNTISIDQKISLSTLPTYAWYKENTLSNISGTFSASKVTINSHNYTSEELSTLPSLENFIFPNKKIMSIGDIPIHVNALTDTDTTMNGITESYASILIQYNEVSAITDANENGNFSYNYDAPLPVGTNITFYVKANNDVIYSNKTIQIVYPGELTLDSATKAITFKLSPIKNSPLLCPKTTDLTIVVTDSRVNSSNCKLYASINHDLTSNSGIVLKDSLVMIDKDENITVLSNTPTLVYNGENNGGSIKVTNITWKEQEGILLQITDALVNNLEYQAIITWSIEE